ncbi:mechanosensitive ion channel family protein [Evansella sp. LMS18]|uniref:mechanosensitive ion channel domain-containing protein n=1 Tax=Evansella sp. LMS18 TaxID=2924033 RepID=UPI0020D0710E|nr:mechanosensitive ion channel domain-containing protein [Evansella sp. LMS18]UTR12342.1 mechanosensitive ion channel family protein [Evansella sp. LMS18]
MDESLDTLITNTTLANFLVALTGLLIITIIIRLIRRSIHRYIKDQDNWYRARKAVNILGYITAVIFLAVLYSDMIGGITVVLGMASAGIAFSLREVIISIAGWLTILAGGMFKSGDRVELGGVTGDVIDLGILRTTIMETGQWVDGDLYNGRIVKVANSFVFQQPVYNYSTDFPFLWDEIKIPVKFGSDYTLAREIINRAANNTVGRYAEETQQHWDTMVRKFRIENATTKPMVTLAVSDNWAEFTLRYVVEYKFRRIIKDQLFTEILQDIETHSDKVNLASATFEVVDAPPVKVHLKDHKEKN